jgi:hypothetical protein
VKLTTYRQLVPSQENLDLYVHSPIHLHGVVLNLLCTGTTLPLFHSDWLRAGRPRDRSSSPCRVKNLLHVQTDSGAHPVSYPMSTGDFFLGVKRQGREADHSPPTSAEVNKMWIYTSTPPYVFMAYCLNSFSTGTTYYINLVNFSRSELCHRLVPFEVLCLISYTYTIATCI